MSFKSRKDIPYLKFMEFTQAIEDFKDNEKMVRKMIIHFFFNDKKDNEEDKIQEFTSACIKVSGKPFSYRMDLRTDPASRFVDLENYSKDEQLPELLKLLLKPCFFWQKLDVNKVSIEDAELVLKAFMISQAI
jgi:hypothetical protein